MTKKECYRWRKTKERKNNDKFKKLRLNYKPSRNRINIVVLGDSLARYPKRVWCIKYK